MSSSIQEPVLNAQERLHVATAFRRAKKALWRGAPGTDYDPNRPKFICIALISCRGKDIDRGSIPYPAFNLAEQLIRSRLCVDGYNVGTVETWLIRHGYAKEIHDAHVAQDIQDYRHRWVDALIQELDPEGVTA